MKKLQKTEYIGVLILFEIILITSTTMSNTLADAEYEIKKLQLAGCEELFGEYRQIGERMFYERYIQFRDQRVCTKLYDNKYWSSSDNIREEKLISLLIELDGNSKSLKVRSQPDIDSITPWMKEDGWKWATGELVNTRFVYVLQQMIQFNIINVDLTYDYKIPEWFKSNTQWWAEGKISDSEYLNSIEYLNKKGILVI